jgi:hypothetical protein
MELIEYSSDYAYIVPAPDKKDQQELSLYIFRPVIQSETLWPEYALYKTQQSYETPSSAAMCLHDVVKSSFPSFPPLPKTFHLPAACESSAMAPICNKFPILAVKNRHSSVEIGVRRSDQMPR